MPAPLVDIGRYDLSKVVLGRAAIAGLLPQRFEFEQVDGVLALDVPNQVAVGYRDLRPDEFWVRGHVPGNPLFPGVLMIEAAAQLSAILYKKAIPDVAAKFIAFAGIDGVRFRGSVRAGQRLLLVAKGVETSSRACRCAVQGIVDGKIVFEATILGVPLTG